MTKLRSIVTPVGLALLLGLGVFASFAASSHEAAAQPSGIELGALCVDFRTGIVSAPRNPASTDCPPGYITLTIPGSFPFTLAVNPSTGQVLYSFGTPPSRFFTIQIPEAGVVSFCVYSMTGQLRYTFGAPCGFGYLPVLLVGELAPDAQDDGPYTVQVGNNQSLATPGLLANDDLGLPAGSIVSFGGGSLGGGVTDNPAGTTVLGTFDGGDLTVNADGSLVVSNPTQTGIFTFAYRLENAAGFSDATVTIQVQGAPTANTDGPSPTSSPGDAFHTALNTTLDSSASPADDNLRSNDALGFPVGTISSFGGGDLGGSVTSHTAGTTVNPLPEGSGSLVVNADGSFVFTPPTNFTGLYTFDYRLTNSAGSSDATVTLAVGVRPSASNDTYDPTVLGNVRIDTTTSSTFSVLTNDAGDQLVITPFDATSVQGGEVVVNADGTFRYDPLAGYKGADSFAYTIDNGFNAPQVGTVNLTVDGMIWFIDQSASAGGDGRLSAPFSCLVSASCFSTVASASIGDTIFVASGSYTGGLTLLANQDFIGAGASASIVAISGLTPPADSPALPATGEVRPQLTTTNADAITLGSGNTVRGLNVGDTGTGTGITGNNFGTLNLSEMAISGTGQAVDLDNGTTNVAFDSLSSTNSPAQGIDLTNLSAGSAFSGGPTTVTNATANGIRLQTIGAGSDIDFGTTNINSRNATGIFLDGVSDAGGTVSFGATTIANPNSATGYGLRIEDSGAAFTFAATTVSATVVGTAGTYNATTERPTNDGDGDAIFLKNNTGSVTINGGTLSDIADNAVDIRNSSNTVLKNIVIQDGGDGNSFSTVNSAIQWHQGNNLTLNGVNMSNIGNNVAVSTGGVNVSDDGLKAYDVSGNLIIQNSIFNTGTGYVLDNATTGSENRAVELDNDTGTNLNVTVTGTSIINWDFQGLNLRHIGGTLDVDIGDGTVAGVNTFQNINGAAVDTGPSAGALTNDHTLDLLRNTFTTVGIAANVFSSNGGTSTVRIIDNTITGTTSDALRLLAFNNGPVSGAADARFYARVTNNNITNIANNVPEKGGGNGVLVAIEDDATAQVLVDANTIAGHTNIDGDPASFITTQHQRGGDLDLVITNNIFSNPTNNFFGAVFLQLNGSEITGTSVSNQCVRFGSNSYTNATIGLFANSHAVDFTPDGGNDVFSVEGFTGSTPANFDSFLSSVETSFTGGGPETLFFGTAPGNATCSIPNVPTAP